MKNEHILVQPTIPQTWIIIVNYRTAELVSDCLYSLESEVNDLGGGRVVVDGWLEQASEYLSEHPDVVVVCGR